MIDIELVNDFVSKDQEISIESLKEYIKSKALSPAYDKEGKQELVEAANFLLAFLKKQINDELIIKVGNYTVMTDNSPLLCFSVDPISTTETYSILLYCHLDKIPAAKEDTDAYTPKIENNILYGKGCANDGYAFFSIITAIKAIQAQTTQKHPLIHVIVESASESGSSDLNYYFNILSYIKPDMIICLDSEAPTYDNLWITTSMRGEMHFDVDVKVTTRGVHCGKFGGIIPDSFMILKELFKRLETIKENQVSYPLLEKPIPEETMTTLTETASILGDDYYKKHIPLEKDVHLLNQTTKDLYINNTYKPALFVTGQEGLPDLDHAGASLRPQTRFRINLKTPPIGDIIEDLEKVKNALTENPPFSAPLQIENDSMIQGFECKKISDKLLSSLKIISSGIFDQPQPYFCSIGDNFPYVIILKEKFPKIPIILTGAAGISSNRYGLKENLDLKYWHDITASLAVLISQYESFKN